MVTVFDRETLTDILVNIVPMVIIAIFLFLLLLYAPWGYDLFPMVITVGLHLVPLVLLAILTYAAVLAIEGSTEESNGDTRFR